MTYLLARTTVEEFEAWESEFEKNDPFRTEHGQEGYQSFRSVDDPDEIVVLFDWADGEDPRAFFRSDEMRDRMAEAGVKGVPEMSVVELVDRKSATEQSP